MNQLEQFFKTVIKPKETNKQIAYEYISLKETYGNMLTQAIFCKVKGISAPTLSKALNEIRKESKK